MNVQLFKEPAPVFVVTAIATMIFLFIESRVKGVKKPYKEYLVYGAFVGVLSLVMQYAFHLNLGGKGSSQSKVWIVESCAGLADPEQKSGDVSVIARDFVRIDLSVQPMAPPVLKCGFRFALAPGQHGQSGKRCTGSLAG